ncbi:unnamed protein product [Larinioides sclopetarius]|uniref:Thyroglobulin type-1 domain-containing protein n=1 Tax=Larinioides sclopetarius TaxID=280406 RepID=A0AAV2ANF3_9ARAC
MHRYISFLLLVFVISFAFANGDDDDEYPGRGDRPCDYDRAEARAAMVIGNYIPQCDENGYYQKFQCINSNGECYCADADGDYLKAAEEPEECE